MKKLLVATLSGILALGLMAQSTPQTKVGDTAKPTATTSTQQKVKPAHKKHNPAHGGQEKAPAAVQPSK
jgi:hypothetical protein